MGNWSPVTGPTRTSGAPGGVTVLAAGAREPRTITEAHDVWQRLDHSQPVAVLCLGVLDALTDAEAADIVRTLREACAALSVRVS